MTNQFPLKTKRALVLGAGGFIGHHLVNRLKKEGYFVRGVDLKHPEFSRTQADEFLIADLRRPSQVEIVVDPRFDEVYQLAADMGGAGYIFTGENDADIMSHSALINLNVVQAVRENKIKKIFYSSSACIYPRHTQTDSQKPDCSEATAYPADPDSEYGWEKLFSERFYLASQKNYGLQVRIARLHNVFGPWGTWRGGKEKAPAALCRKVAEAKNGSSIEVWGDGEQTRSFLYIDECIEGILRLMNSDFSGPVNLGSLEMVSLNQLAKMIIEISGKNLGIQNIPGPLGVRGRCSDNALIQSKLGWAPRAPLKAGLIQLYQWIDKQIREKLWTQNSTKFPSLELEN